MCHRQPSLCNKSVCYLIPQLDRHTDCASTEQQGWVGFRPLVPPRPVHRSHRGGQKASTRCFMLQLKSSSWLVYPRDARHGAPPPAAVRLAQRRRLSKLNICHRVGAHLTVLHMNVHWRVVCSDGMGFSPLGSPLCNTHQHVSYMLRSSFGFSSPIFSQSYMWGQVGRSRPLGADLLELQHQFQQPWTDLLQERIQRLNEVCLYPSPRSYSTTWDQQCANYPFHFML